MKRPRQLRDQAVSPADSHGESQVNFGAHLGVVLVGETPMIGLESFRLTRTKKNVMGTLDLHDCTCAPSSRTLCCFLKQPLPRGAGEVELYYQDPTQFNYIHLDKLTHDKPSFVTTLPVPTFKLLAVYSHPEPTALPKSDANPLNYLRNVAIRCQMGMVPPNQADKLTNGEAKLMRFRKRAFQAIEQSHSMRWDADLKAEFHRIAEHFVLWLQQAFFDKIDEEALVSNRRALNRRAERLVAEIQIKLMST
ncbi:MAG: hypothetical protein SGPRY_013435 [Prymnesium sp.]